eukprot:UN09901
MAFDLAGTAVAGTDYDFLDVSGNVNLDGTLALFWENNFTSVDTDSFDLIQTGGVFSGTF